MTRTEKARRRTASANEERGAAAVEFAILLPILVVIIFGVIAFGIAFARLETYISAAREGARFAAVHCQPDALTCTPALIAIVIIAGATALGLAINNRLQDTADCVSAGAPCP